MAIMIRTSTAVQVAAPFAVVASLEVVGGRSRSARTEYTVKGIERVNISYRVRCGSGSRRPVPGPLCDALFPNASNAGTGNEILRLAGLRDGAEVRGRVGGPRCL